MDTDYPSPEPPGEILKKIETVSPYPATLEIVVI